MWKNCAEVDGALLLARRTLGVPRCPAGCHTYVVGRYLVTGCAGFIGSHLAAALLDEGEQVVGVDSLTDYYARELKLSAVQDLRERRGFSFFERDLAVDSLADVIAGTDCVFHLAAQPGVRGSWGSSFAVYARDNLLASQCVFEEAATEGVRVAFASSSSIYGNAEAYPTPEEATPAPISPYGVTKLACEQLAEAYRVSRGLDVVILRYFTVYGPRQRPDMAYSKIIRALLDATPFPVFGSGEQTRDVTYVSDAISAALLVADRAPTGAIYNVGGGTEASLLEVIAALEQESGNQLEVRFESDAPGDVRRTGADTSRIRHELGWAPTTALEQGLVAQLAWAAATVERR